MENYALYILENALRDEYGYLEQANSILNLNLINDFRDAKTLDNFRESKRKAMERIPQLEEAIEKWKAKIPSRS